VRYQLPPLASDAITSSAGGAMADVEYEVKAGEGSVYFIAPSAGSYTLHWAAERSLPAPAPIPTL
jgi:hypothetical protein